MTERDHMVIGLVKELLGPRYGAFEILPKDRDPRSEYILGVLAPEQKERDIEDIDADIDEVIEEVADDENQGTEGVVIAPPSVFSPALDPKSQPRSIGLSFVITTDDYSDSFIDICLTWARYEQVVNGWQRKPEGKIFPAIQISEDCSLQYSAGSDVEFHIRVREQSHKVFRVSLYFVNQRKRNDQKLTTPDFVFQPEIRVHCITGHLTSIDQTSAQGFDDPLSAEDVELAMLYRERTALARGHLCGAIWKAVDPERPHPDLISPNEPPFAWIDGPLIADAYRSRFSPADVRTEMLPCYPVEAPETHWAWSDRVPEFHPLVLAETWEVNDLERCLQPLVDGYNQWIVTQRKIVTTLPSHWQPVALRNLEKCQHIAERMGAGIRCLVSDEEARLAFCFANQAIALQSQWARKGVAVPWRPFQLAFILLNIVSIAYPTDRDREICDLLWFPTGGGKTEAYLGLTAFTLALRRVRARNGGQNNTGGGVSVLSRYTLRLLTIQQFRRALGVITACEVLRVQNLKKKQAPIGWRPKGCPDKNDFLWGGMRFSAGMWVGGNVTPNNLTGFSFKSSSGGMRYVAGAVEILQGVSSHGYNGSVAVLARKIKGMRVEADGDPAQVLTCPVCQSILAIPEEGLGQGTHTVHFVFSGRLKKTILSPSILNRSGVIVNEVLLTSHIVQDTNTISITFTVAESNRIDARDVDNWWNNTIQKQIPMSDGTPQLLAARPSRPGYFISTFQNKQSSQIENNFEIYCPDPVCLLNQQAWAEQVPISVASNGVAGILEPPFLAKSFQIEKKKWTWQNVPTFVQYPDHPQKAERIPIPAYTTDDQVYHRCPSMVIATVDKFARLSYEPKASGLFGNVTHYHSRWGFYREGSPPGTKTQDGIAYHPPAFTSKQYLHTSVNPFLPPDLIIQDELHLLEGPLGSMVGLYETAVDALCEREVNHVKVRPKYIASTATVRQAESQVQSLFARRLAQFPPSAIDADDRFFARTKETHPLESSNAGRLYVAVAGPGKGAQTPIVRIWSTLLQTAYERKLANAGDDLDGFWTLVGYFNALRELAGAAALYRQDIRERIQSLGDNIRYLGEQALELSSRANSLALPGYLERLGKAWLEDVVLATSMFGTGVDVDRLGLMVIHGQPKSTSSYIQATGRVGRRQGGLVVTFFRVSRPRDLDHYEFFTGYHRMLYRAVEPVTVTPFAPRARERGLGPLAVALLRQGQNIDGVEIEKPWNIEQRVTGGIYSEASLMATNRHIPEVGAIPGIFERRAIQQPEGRRPREDSVEQEISSDLDRWQALAYEQSKDSTKANDRFVYTESSMLKNPERGVVLGDAQHQMRQLPVTFRNTPNSLRDVEVTTQFKE